MFWWESRATLRFFNYTSRCYSVFLKFGQSHCEYGPQQSVEALSNEYPETVARAESKLTGTILPDFMVAICTGASAFAVEVVPGSEAIATAPESKSVAAEAEAAATTRFFFVRIYAYPFDQLSHQRSWFSNSHIYK